MVNVAFSLSMPLPCRLLYAFVPDAIVHQDVPAFVSILTRYVITPFLPFATKRSVINVPLHSRSGSRGLALRR